MFVCVRVRVGVGVRVRVFGRMLGVVVVVVGDADGREGRL